MCCYTHNLYNNAKKFHALWSLKKISDFQWKLHISSSNYVNRHRIEHENSQIKNPWIFAKPTEKYQGGAYKIPNKKKNPQYNTIYKCFIILPYYLIIVTH